MNPNVTVILLAVAAATASAQGPNRRASVDSAGIPANNNSSQARMTPDARFVAFVSLAHNLVPGDGNATHDVFVHDRQGGITTRVSVDGNGTEADGSSSDPAITPDGRYVVFTSGASNLVAMDTNMRSDVFRHDRVTGSTVLVSCSQLGIQGNEGSSSPTISDDGRYVAFKSLASNLLPGDGNGAADVFVKDLQTSAVVLASTAGGAQPGNLHSLEGKLSGNGRYVAFRSYASNLVANDSNGVDDVFVRDLLLGTTTRANLGPYGVQANNGGYLDGITRDGSEVVYASFANLAAGDANFVLDVYVSARDGSRTELISRRQNGSAGNDTSLHAAISPDGRYVAFDTRASDLLPGDLNHIEDIGLFDRTTGTMQRASRNLGGGDPSGTCVQPAVSGDGRFIAFASGALNLIAGKNTNWLDIVVIDLHPALPATVTIWGQGCPGRQGAPWLDRESASLPWLGTTFRFHGGGAPGRTTGLVAVGWSRTSWNGMPLPFALDGVGMPGCTLFTSAELMLPLFTAPNGSFPPVLPIPVGSMLLGMQLHAQAWLVDPWANNALGATVSNAVTLRLGG